MTGYLKATTAAQLPLTRRVQAGLAIHAAVSLLLVLDGQLDCGDQVHLRHTLSMAEAASSLKIEIENQLTPKQAPHHVNIGHLIPRELMVEKIKAAVATRHDPNSIIIGRTNECPTDDLDEALRGAEDYKHACADILLRFPRRLNRSAPLGGRLKAHCFT